MSEGYRFYHNEIDDFLKSRIDEEEARALKAEGMLADATKAESSAREKADAELSAAISAESERAIAAEGDLRSTLEAESERLDDAEEAIAAEEERAMAEEKRLSDAVDSLEASSAVSIKQGRNELDSTLVLYNGKGAEVANYGSVHLDSAGEFDEVAIGLFRQGNPMLTMGISEASGNRNKLAVFDVRNAYGHGTKWDFLATEDYVSDSVSAASDELTEEFDSKLDGKLDATAPYLTYEELA